MDASSFTLAGISRNRVLAHLPVDDLSDLERHLVPVHLPIAQNLGTPGRPQRHVYFPVSGLVSREALTTAGETVEVGLVGREGLVGIEGILGQPQLPHSVLVQAAGSSFRAPVQAVRDLFLRSNVFADQVHQHVYLQMAQLAQTALCNRLHPLECRIARWLLTSSDRLGCDQLSLTQEFLAHMLGSSRSTVTVMAGKLQQAGILEYSRGQVVLLDRARLEAASCECYSIVRGLYRRVLGPY